MDENAVVDAVCKYLVADGYEIVTRLTTKQRGTDVVARNPTKAITVFVEAKGGTSSREGSNRYGKPYDSSQVFDVIAKGIFSCLRLRGLHPEHKTNRVLLAIPDMSAFRDKLKDVEDLLQQSHVEVWYAQSPSSRRAGA